MSLCSVTPLLLLWCAVCLSVARVAAISMQSAEEDVRKHVDHYAKSVMKDAEGMLSFPFLIPGGYYKQLWDWDSMFTGVGLLEFGSAPYLAGSMLNFLANSTEDGKIPGCLTPSGPSAVIYHAKPVLVQGALIAAKATGDYVQFHRYKHQMESILQYWERERKDNETGLYVWYNVMESGADNLPVAAPETTLSVSSSDVMVFLYREFISYSLFLRTWASQVNSIHARQWMADAQTWKEKAEAIKTALNRYLWDEEKGHFVAYDIKRKEPINNRVYLLAFPLWEPTLLNQTQIQRLVQELTKEDMWTDFGIRSTSSLDSSYNNIAEIDPYSNWQGPVWINFNVVYAYALKQLGFNELAETLANRIVNLLSKDLAVSGTWHECYHSETGEGLIADGFLSWNVLAASLLKNIRENTDPFQLS
eukprot:GILJ01009637.1.p1 GENE.GILJ01009637.1~~GILJ01009637.1.p1  ORF type:complete len:419 (-),score=52.69 GILJ01009637.1:73-1329(-)